MGERKKINHSPSYLFFSLTKCGGVCVICRKSAWLKVFVTSSITTHRWTFLPFFSFMVNESVSSRQNSGKDVEDDADRDSHLRDMCSPVRIGCSGS